MGESTETELPPSYIEIQDGKVVRIEEWTMWNGQPWPTFTLTRTTRLGGPESFRCSMGDPEHGGGSASGSLEHVLEGLHPEIARKYTEVMEMVEPTGHKILHTPGFEHYQVINR